MSWAEERSAAAAEHDARLRARQDAEHRKAELLIGRFAEAARRASLPTTELRVHAYRGRRTAKTGIQGWLLRIDGKAGIDTNGNFYVLSSPLSFLQTLRTYTPAPTRPPLILGAGGRDGDSVPLADALERLLPGWGGTAA